MPLIGNKKGRSVTRVQFEAHLKTFVAFLKRQLNLRYDIPIILVDDVSFAKRISAFGEISEKNLVHISIINRHPMDIFRTVAHEYVHYKQHIERSREGSHPGITTENQANAKAGELLRKYGNLHPELFELMPIK